MCIPKPFPSIFPTTAPSIGRQSVWITGCPLRPWQSTQAAGRATRDGPFGPAARMGCSDCE